jgi:hypothetical protein
MRAGAAWFGVVMAGVMSSAGCAADPPATPPPTEAPPSYVGQVALPVHARATSGATADITLNGATWVPAPCAGGWGCAALEVTITNTSALPFKYSEDGVSASFGGGPQPWTHPEDSNLIGASTDVNYIAINKMPPLRRGAVPPGQSVHGFVGLGFGGGSDMRGTDLFVTMTDPDGGVDAGWQVHI